MSREINDIDELLGKYLAGEATPDETALVDEWVQHSDENRVHFNELKKIFDHAASIKELRAFDTDAAWNKLRSRLNDQKIKRLQIETTNKTIAFPWWRAAAAILVLALFVYFLRSGSDSIVTTEVVAESRVVSDTLPDGSTIFLNKETKIQYAYDKRVKSHAVKLVGEAYFNIKNEKHEQFVIDAGDVFIKDIGTSFNVKAYPGSDVVEVLVEEGEIIFYTEENPGIHLKESGKAIYNKKTKEFTIDQPEPNITAYKTKFFVFSSTNLGEVATSLNLVYEKQVVVPEHLRACPITVSFRDESIEDIAAVIAETLSLTVREEGDKVILDGDACE